MREKTQMFHTNKQQHLSHIRNQIELIVEETRLATKKGFEWK